MGRIGASTGRRLRWLAAFTLLLLGSTAVPVLADSEPAPGPTAAVPSGDEEAPTPPDPIAVQAALEDSERKEKDRKRWLQGPEAEQARESSRRAFADLGPVEAKELLRERFGEQLAFLNQNDPARLISDAVVRSVYPGEGARIELDGQKLLLDGAIPTHAKEEDGELAKVDLDLEATAEGFEAKNPLVELSISESAGGPVQIGEEGIAISAVGSADSVAQRLGEKDVQFHEVHEDTDRLVSPIGPGVEIFDLLRSEDSPETLRYRLTLPEGATLRAAGEGAEVARGGETLMRVRPPVAIDAQGSDVPVTMEVEGDTLVLSVPHRGMDLAYPALVDPIFEWEIQEDWYSQNWYHGYHLNNLYHWDYHTNSSWIYGQTYTIYRNFGGSGRGLHVSSKSGDFGPGKWGHWAYDLPNLNAYIEAISVLPFWYDNHGCQKYSYQQPDDYVGLWDAGNSNWVTLSYNDSYYKGHSDVGFPNANPGWGHMVMIGLSMGSGPNIPCWRDFYAGGALLYLSDWADPEIANVAGIPGAWIGDDTQFTITANAYDAGLGVREVAFNPEGSPTLVDHVGCSGLAGDRCPTAYGSDKKFTEDALDQGRRWIRASAIDALGRGSETITAWTKVDRTPPEVTLSGQLAQATNEGGSSEKPAGKGDELLLPVYRLDIDAEDGSNAENSARRSGVKDIRVYLDGVEQEVPWEAQPCPEDSCSMNVSYELTLHDVESGKHVLEVDTEDQVGEVRRRDIEFEYFPATGMKDEYVMHYFPLPDGQGSEAEEEHPKRPELAVNVMNGNLLYREQDIDVEGPAVDLEVERYYNSLLPEEESTEWGEGWTLAQTPDLEPEGGEGAPSQAELIDESGAHDGEVELPTQVGAESFDPKLQATVTKEPAGYELTDETGESATTTAFDEGGRTEELRTGEGTPEEATVDYDYEGGELAEIAVEDPGSAGSPTEEPKEEESEEPEEPGELATYLSAFGSYGSGNGQLSGPRDVALGPAGDIWVADLYNHRIQQFSAGGQFIRAVGSYGSANGQFNHPSSIDVDAQGNVWVADSGNDRIQKLSAEGGYLAKFGSSGSGNGQLSWPAGIAIDPQGDIWVAESGNSRVQEFSPQGAYLGGFGEEGDAEGQFYGPEAIDVDPSGDVWVADTYGNRLQKFSPEGEYLLEADAEAGPFDYPMGLAADAKGNVWVADTYGSRIQVFDSQGAHLGEIGSAGEGEGQLLYPMGIDVGPGGRIWIADTEGNRIQRWQAGAAVSPKTGIYLGGSGSEGSQAGQFSSPVGVATDPEGDVLIADSANNRIQRFDSEGRFVDQFGTPGAADGQLSSPYGVAADAEGNVWVADSGNDRIQKFDAEGNYLSQFGEEGTGNGQLAMPFGITIDDEGDIWVTESQNQRVQELDAQGQFIQKFGEEGTGSGQFSFPFDIAIDEAGKVWVSDAVNSRIQQFTAQGQLIRAIGSEGAGGGQLVSPTGIDIGPEGGVWVADSANDRVQGFSTTGQYIGQFGEAGSEEGQLSLPFGLAADSTGGFWLSDAGNNRIQWWRAIEQPPAGEPLPQDDPVVDVETSSGLVESVEGVEAGAHTYEHEGELLTAHEGPQGETTYDYDEEGRLTKVTLPNGTWGEVSYHATYGRVSKVTVKPAGGEQKTTFFDFYDEPRRTVVDPPDAPHVTYDIGADGSVLKWWNAEKPPEFDDLAGTLHSQYVIDPNEELSHGDHNLVTQAYSEEGIASIEVIAEGDTLVDEMACEQTEEPGIECKTLLNEWVTHTELHPPGRLDLEVIITDSLGNSAAERFWVKVPKPPPPPPPGAQLPPKFHEILKFREEFGLEVVFPVKDELERNDRIFNLIGAWYNPHTAEGKVARASMKRWGVPLRQVDVEEMEFREAYVAQADAVIPQWTDSHGPSTYAGYYVDHRQGGKLRIGFTENQSSRVSELESVLAAPDDRVTEFSFQPTRSLDTLSNNEEVLVSSLDSHPSIRALVTRTESAIPTNKVAIGSLDVAALTNYVNANFGSNAPYSVFYEPNIPAKRVRTRPLSRHLWAGDWISGQTGEGLGDCSLGFGATEVRRNKPNGAPINDKFAFTAGHCFVKSTSVKQVHAVGNNDYEERDFGTVWRRSYFQEYGDFFTDGELIKLSSGFTPPRRIYLANNIEFSPVKGAEKMVLGSTLCTSGRTTGVTRCGAARGPFRVFFGGGAYSEWVVGTKAFTDKGDSGGAVWNLRNGKAVGLVSAGPAKTPSETWFAPLRPVEARNGDRLPGLLELLDGKGPKAVGPLKITALP